MSDDKKVIFSMSGVSKTYQGANKQVLKNIYLSFFYGAKIGILGLNGSGKSTLLKIIAAIEKNYQGDVVFAPGYTVGFLSQEPKLDDDKTVIDIVKEGLDISRQFFFAMCFNINKWCFYCCSFWVNKYDSCFILHLKLSLFLMETNWVPI